MGLYVKENNSCYFIHIPRTGGRYVRALFHNTPGIECKYHRFDIIVDGKEVCHFHYPLYNDLSNVKNVPHITIVRNPIDRFFSLIRNIGDSDIIKFNSITSEDDFINFIKFQLEVESFHNNWFLPQSKFVSNKTNIWKYEQGFNEDFFDWILDKTGIQLTNKKVNYAHFENENQSEYDIDINKIKNYIKNFYHEDFKMFGYDEAL